MAGANETPRQKMMGILYLVLLGLAATTVTDHVLDAFHNLTESLETSTKNVQTTVSNTFASFEATKLKNEPERSKPFWDKANQVKKLTSDLDAYIVQIKGDMYKAGGGALDNGDVASRDNIDISPQLMINQGRAKELKKRILSTRTQILSILSPSDTVGLKLALNADDQPRNKYSPKTSWEEDNFGDGIPLTAAVTALTKIQADLKNTESDVVKKILGEADKAVVNLDRFEAVAVAPSSYVLIGQQYTADVFLTASDSKSDPEISVGGQTLKVQDGKGLYTVAATRDGDFKWVGTVRVKQADGTVKEYQTGEQAYTVAKPSGVVSPDKMNVFYIGLDNPVSISAPGFSLEKVKPSISGGTITGSNGKYVVRVTKAGKVTVTLTGELEGGKTVTVGSSEFRCKVIPAPRVKFGAKFPGTSDVVFLKAQRYLFAELADFDFETKFNINHFRMIIIKPRSGDPVQLETDGNALNSQMLSALAGITPGTRIIFDYITATGPDGVKRPLDEVPTFLAK